MREYNKRLILAFIAFIVLFGLVRVVVVPKSFGEYGWYRGESVGEIADRPLMYANSEECAGCHKLQYDAWANGAHKNVNCETCKAPGKQHAENPAAQKMEFNVSIGLCEACHEENPSKPKSQPQVDIYTHSRGQLCTTCHNPHSPILGASSAEVSSTASAETIFSSKCSGCHTSASLFGDLSKSEQEWKDGVTRMSSKYVLGLTDEQMDLISAYLKKNYGK